MQSNKENKQDSDRANKDILQVCFILEMMQVYVQDLAKQKLLIRELESQKDDLTSKLAKLEKERRESLDHVKRLEARCDQLDRKRSDLLASDLPEK